MQPTLMAKRVKIFWDEWGVELLVTVSCGMHMVLTLFGSSRRRMKGHQSLVRFIIWSAYLLSSYVVTVIMGKLTLIHINGSAEDNTDSELKGFLAPLLLVQLGSRDDITAYSIEDDRLGIRQFPNLLAQLSAVLWILFRSWNYSLVSYLYFPCLLAGVIKSGENAWALYTALSGSSGVTNDELIEQEASIPEIAKHMKGLPANIPNLEMIVKAYYRILWLKPHIENWIYRPLLCPSLADQLSLPHNSSAQDIFKISDLELGFMYDVLYTKAPLVYTRMGFVLRLITSLSLVSCSVVFAFWFADAFVYYINAGFVLVVLGVIITLEAYQIYVLFFSDWAIVKMSNHSENPTVKRLLSFLAPRSSRWKRWSNTMGQFSLIRYCLDYDHLYFSRILKFQRLDVEVRKFFCTTSVVIREELKEMLNRERKELDEVRASKPITTRGEWALSRYGITANHDLLKRSVEGTEFDKSIIVWHLATEICYHSLIENQHLNQKITLGRHLSSYMMYLLATRPQMLSITSTSEVVFEDARKQIMAFLTRESLVTDVKTACSQLLKPDVTERVFKGEKQTTVTQNWYPLADAKRMSEDLLRMGDSIWEVICSVWVEMLCFAATNCRAEYHSEQLRRGGEIATHVWLMLLHKTRAAGDTARDLTRNDPNLTSSSNI